MKNQDQHYKREILFCTDHFPCKVVFNPSVNHWYLDTNTVFPMDTYPTKKGAVIPASLTKTMEATEVFGVNIEHFTSYDVLFLKDQQGRIGVFSMVSTNQEFGNFYRTDHKGFGYKKAKLYIDTKAYHQVRGAQHYLITEDLSGAWSLVCLYHPQDYIQGAYNEMINRRCLAKGFNSEAAILDFFKNTLSIGDLMDNDIYALFDITSY